MQTSIEGTAGASAARTGKRGRRRRVATVYAAAVGALAVVAAFGCVGTADAGFELTKDGLLMFTNAYVTEQHLFSIKSEFSSVFLAFAAAFAFFIAAAEVPHLIGRRERHTVQFVS
jgi:hypothetical protein